MAICSRRSSLVSNWPSQSRLVGVTRSMREGWLYRVGSAAALGSAASSDESTDNMVSTVSASGWV